MREQSRSSKLRDEALRLSADDTDTPGDRGTKPSLRDKFRDICRTVPTALYSCCEHVDLFISIAPNYVQAVWGSIRILLLVQVRSMELREAVRKHLLDIRDKFRLLDLLQAYCPTTSLIRAVSVAYASYATFLSNAVQYYSRNRWSTFRHSSEVQSTNTLQRSSLIRSLSETSRVFWTWQKSQLHWLRSSS
jgi:hypothetical protein